MIIRITVEGFISHDIMFNHRGLCGEPAEDLKIYLMEKKVKCRKDHVCACCEQIIKKGQYANYLSFRQPRFADDYETQIGIEYYKCWLHIDPDVCDKFLKQEGELDD